MTCSQTPTRAIKRSLQYKRPQPRTQPANSNHKHHIRRPPPPYHRSIHTHLYIHTKAMPYTKLPAKSSTDKSHNKQRTHHIIKPQWFWFGVSDIICKATLVNTAKIPQAISKHWHYNEVKGLIKRLNFDFFKKLLYLSYKVLKSNYTFKYQYLSSYLHVYNKK